MLVSTTAGWYHGPAMHEFFIGYTVLHWIATWANPFCDAFFRAVTDLGHQTFYYLSIAPLFWVVDRRRTLVLFLLLILSAYVNTYAKILADIPRPDPTLARVLDLRPYQSGSKSFPSGHAQNALVFWGYLAWWARRRWCAVLAGVLVALISFSRLYLGVHFPIDIAGGLLLGALLMPAVPALERWAARDFAAPLGVRLAVLIAPTAALLTTGDLVIGFVSASLITIALALWWLPQRPFVLRSRGQAVLVVAVGLGLEILLSQFLGQVGPTDAPLSVGWRVMISWLVALWAFPHAVAAVIPQPEPAVAA